MSFNIDDLLNSALDELQIQEDEKKNNVPEMLNEITSQFRNATTTVTNNSENKPTESTTTINNIEQQQQSTTNTDSTAVNNEKFMADIFEEVFNDPKMKELIEGYSQEEGEDFDQNAFKNHMKNLFGPMGGAMSSGGSGLPDLSSFGIPNAGAGDNKSSDPFSSLLGGMSESEKKELQETMEKMSSMFGGGGAGFDFGNLDNNSNNNNNNMPAGVDFKDFENNISSVLNGIANNAATSNNTNSGDSTSDIFKNLASMMSQGGEDLSGMNDSINEFYDESMKYIVENYPKWIDDNKNNYSAEEITKFREQCELFMKLFNSESDKSMGQDEMLDKITLLGQLPEAFCDQYCKDIQDKIEPPK